MTGTAAGWRRRVVLRILVAALMVAGVLAGGPPPLMSLSGADEPDPANIVVDDEIDALAVTAPGIVNSNVIWSSRRGCAPGTEFPPVCRIRRGYLSGSFSTVFSNALGPDSGNIASGVARDQRHYYWVNKAGEVLRAYYAESFATPELIATAVDTSASFQIAADSTHVYWVENTAGGGSIYRAPNSGGTPELMYDNDRAISQLRADGRGGVLFVTDVFAFVCCVDLLHRVVPTASGFDDDHVDFQGVDSYAVSDHNTVYFITTMGSGGRPQLREALLHDLGNDFLWQNLDGAGDPSWPAMTAGPGSTVFWQEIRADDGPIFRFSAGGSPEAITGNLPSSRQLEVVRDDLLAVNRGRLLRYPLDTEARRLDLVGDEVDLEVVQATQSSTHDVPLVAGKQTFVRLYGRIGESSEGISRLSAFPEGALHGTRGGVALPGSPLTPVERDALLTVPGIDRTHLDTTLLFELPKSWTEGEVSLRGEINPSRSEVEVDYTNNVSERTVTFGSERGICLDMLPVLTTAGVSEDGFTPEILGHFQRAKSMYPTARFGGAFRGGTPRTIPLANDPYNMFDQDHKNMLLMNLTVEFMFSSPPAQCGDRHTIRTAYVPDASNFGTSNPIAPTIWALRRDDGFFPENTPRGAVKGLAHEVGHQFGISHILCPGPGMTGQVPAGPYETYPYNPCQIDDTNNHIGFDAITRRLIVPLPTDGTAPPTDFNSYGQTLNWASDYSYRKIHRQLETGDTLGPVGGEGAGTDTAPPAAVLAGYVADDGSGFLGYAFDADETAGLVSEAITDRTTPSPDHELRVFDDGGLVSASPLNVAHVDTEDGGHSNLFLHSLDPATPMTRVEIVDVATDSVVLDRSAGAMAPDVSITSPAGGDVVGDTMNLRWTASDADGDTLAHTVRYSTDGGVTWTALGTNLSGTELPVDMSTMPGGSNAFVEVIASDGLHSTSARVGPFEVSTHQPQVQIMTDSFDALDASTPASFRQSDVVVLRGHAYDAEDGELTGEDLTWSLTGRVTRSGSGDVFRTSGLPPGTYDLELAGTDSDGGTTTATTQVHIMPKLMSAGAATLDGECADPAYEADTDPILLRYADGDLAGVRAVHDDEDLFVCFGGLPAADSLEEVELRIDLDGDGGSTTGARELFFRADNTGGVQSGHGDGSGSDVVVLGEDVDALATFGDGSWNLELRIERSLLEPHAEVIGLRASHTQDPGGTETMVAWPPGSSSVVPDTWGAATFGAGGLVAEADDAVGDEGSAIPLDASVSGADDVSTSWSVPSSAPCTVADPGALHTTVTCTDDGVFTLTLAASAGGETRFAHARVTVRNVAPMIDSVVVPVDPVEVGTGVDVGVMFHDPGAGDTHTCRIDWGDGTTPSAVAASGGECTAGHVYDEAGTFTLEIRVSDDDGGADGETVQYIVVYDPSAGFVTGGGWIDSPAGAYPANPDLTGRASFGLTSRYRKGAHVPDGSTQFRFKVADLEFRSTEYQWLVVSGARAQYKGSGMLNGGGDYGFIVSVVDGQVSGGRDIDRFRIKIWDKTSGDIVYDNQLGEADDAAASTALGGGSIVIHKGR